MNPAIATPFLTIKRMITPSGRQQMETWVQNHVMGVPVTSSSWENSTGLTVVKHNSHWQCQDFHCLENISRSLTTSSSRIKRKSNVLTITSSVREHGAVKLSPKLSEVMKGKLSLGARILQLGGMQKFFRYLFGVCKKERLIKASQCYLSTTAGPIAGVLFISTEKVAFCSERMITLSSSDGGSVRVLYKVAIPLAKIETVNESVNMKRSSQKFMQIVTVDKFDFWFMGFLNYQKSFMCLLQVINQA